MSGNLVIVESPAKARTIERYLGPDYTVLASYGHVRDLPENPGKNQLGVDVEHDFEPDYEIVDDRRRQIGAIKKAAGRADLVYLATDLDREGEAIAWHVAEAADIPAEYALLGFDGVRVYGGGRESEHRVLTDAMGFTMAAPVEYALEGGSRHASYVYDEPPSARGLQGAGTVHHIA